MNEVRRLETETIRRISNRQSPIYGHASAQFKDYFNNVIELLKSPSNPPTVGIRNRLTHRVHILEANGPSYRLHKSERRLQQRRSKPKRTDQVNPEDPGPDDESEK